MKMYRSEFTFADRTKSVIMVNLDSNDKFPMTFDHVKEEKVDMFYLTATSIYPVNNLVTHLYNKRKNQVFIVIDTNSSFIINETTYSVKDIHKKLPKATAKYFILAYLHELAVEHRREEYNHIRKVLLPNTDFQVDGMFSANDDIKLSKQVRDILFRKKKSEITMELPDVTKVNPIGGGNFSTMDLLEILAMDDANKYIAVDDYNKIGVSVYDEFNLFKRTSAGMGEFKNLNYNSKHLNISIQFKIDGQVKINPKQAKQHNLPFVIDSCIYRNHAIISDGKLNVSKFQALITKKTFERIIKLSEYMKLDIGFMYYQGDSDNEDGLIHVSFDISLLPILSRNQGVYHDNIDMIKTMNFNLNTFKARKKVLNWYLDNQLKHLPTGKFESKALNEGQIDLLKQHGLDAYFRYNGIDNQKAEATESYTARIFEFKIKGWSSLPKVQDVMERVSTGKNLNEPAIVMANVISEVERKGLSKISTENRDALKDLIKEIENDVLSLNSKLATIKLYKVITETWWDGLEVDGKGNFVYDNLIINADYVTKEK